MSVGADRQEEKEKKSDVNTDASVWVSFFGFSISSFFSTKNEPALEKSKLNM